MYRGTQSAFSGLLRWAPAGPREAGHVRRVLEVLAVVGLWVGIGELMTGMGSQPASGKYAAADDLQWYLVIGIPLVAVFQLFVRRRPLIELWVRDGRPVGRAVAFRALALAIAVYPLYTLIHTLVDPPSGEAAFVLYALAAICGAAAAAYCYVSFDRETWRYLLFCVLTAGLINIVPNVIGDVSQLVHPTPTRPSADWWWGVQSFLLYVPAVMVMEEVAFRGAFDSHAFHEGDRHGVWTAIFVSVLWGIWHLPLVGWGNAASAIISMGAMGTFLSIWWRKSGNLGVSGTTHALADAVRNAIGGTP
jgi:membrane protease YdiL (CAAX protease family)